jgi:hypothetical protein
MKNDLLVVPRFEIAAQGLLLSFCLLLGSSVSAQNLVKNPGFESPIGTNAYGNAYGGADFPLGTTTGGEVYDPSWKSTNNWMIAYPWGGPDDYELKDRCTTARSGLWSGRFRPAHDKLAHAYYTQTITNLEAGRAYLVSGYMKQDWWKSGDAKRDKMKVYIEVVGGQGTPTGDGRASVKAVATDQSNLDAPYTYPNLGWLQFTNSQTPAADGTIEIRLHHNKCGWDIWDKLELSAAYYDDISLTP